MIHFTVTWGFHESKSLARRRRWSLYWFWWKGSFSFALGLGPFYVELNNESIMTREEHRALLRNRGLSVPVLRRWLRRNGR